MIVYNQIQTLIQNSKHKIPLPEVKKTCQISKQSQCTKKQKNSTFLMSKFVMEKSVQDPIESRYGKQPRHQLSNLIMNHSNELPNRKVTNQPETQKQSKPDITSSEQSNNFFDQYLAILNSKIFKRKIILFILNILLTIIALIFAICFIIWSNRSGQSQNDIKIHQVFNTDFSLFTLFFIVALAILSAVFAVIIIKGKVLMLHCYWISCLVSLVIFSIICASAFSLTSMNCEQPSSYILQKIKNTSDSAMNLFCTDTCPCNRLGHHWTDSSQIAERVQDCPGWEEIAYSSFLSTTQNNLKCSGWCKQNKKSYFVFYSSAQTPQASQQISCFDVIRAKIEHDTSYLKIFSIILCVMLVSIIFYTNYYIFMEKEDQNREVKKMKQKMKETQQIMEQELKTSKRMLP